MTSPYNSETGIKCSSLLTFQVIPAPFPGKITTQRSQFFVDAIPRVVGTLCAWQIGIFCCQVVPYGK